MAVVDNRISQLLQKLPRICPKVESISPNKVVKMEEGRNCCFSHMEKDSGCCICNEQICVENVDTFVNILDSITSSETPVVDVVSDLLNCSLDLDICSTMVCNSCFLMVDQFDKVKREVERIKVKMAHLFSAARSQREQVFLWGQQGGGTPFAEWVRVHPRLVPQELESQKPVPSLGPYQEGQGSLVPPLLTAITLYLDSEELQMLQGVQGDPSRGDIIVRLREILRLRPRFSLGDDNTSLELHTERVQQSLALLPCSVEQEEERLRCLQCGFSSQFFHLLIPHLKTHLQNKPELEKRDGTGSMKSFGNTKISSESSGNVKKPCGECGKLFLKAEVLEAHIKKIHQGNNTPWECDQCGKGFTRKASLEEHISRHLGDRQKYCAECDKYFYDTAFWRHLSTVHPAKEKLKHSCPHCSKVFSQRFKLELHLQSHVTFANRKFNCTDCPDKRFASAEKLRSHRRVVHDNKVTGSLLCGECGETFSNFNSLYQHGKRMHDGVGSEQSQLDLFICGFQDCSVGFSSIQELQEHQVASHKGVMEVGEEERVIFMGDITEGGVREVKDDIKTEEEEEEETILSDNILMDSGVEDSGGRPVNSDLHFAPDLVEEFCDTGRRMIISGADRELHTKEDFSEDNEQINGIVNINMSEENTIILTENQGRELIQALNIEMSNSTKIFPCSFCNKVYRNERSRSIHIKSVHLQEKPFQCPQCDKAFACQNYLTEHRKIHSSENRFRCTLCERNFSSNKVLKRHFRVHTGEKPFKCEYCEKRFAAASNLSEHRTLHTGRLPYTCNGCQGKFRLWTTLKKHSLKCEGASHQSKDETVSAAKHLEQVGMVTSNLHHESQESLLDILS